MAKRKSVDDGLRELSAAVDAGPAEARPALAKALGAANPRLVARAAELAGELAERELGPDLEGALRRLLGQPAKADPGCMAKEALVEALRRIEWDEPGALAAASEHRQLEPVWGGKRDTAANLRGNAALALVEMGWPEAPYALARLLCEAGGGPPGGIDDDAPARIAAARAASLRGDQLAEVMLLMKAGLGDPDPRVTAECLEGLGRLATPRAIEALEGFLEDEAGPVAEAAALALGQTRTPEALERLIELRRACADRDRRKALLFPIALVRSEAAFDYLLSVLQREDADGAAAALEALEVFLGGEDRRAQVTAAVEERGEPALLRGLSEMNA